MLVWDETFMYGAQVNYTYQHHHLSYDLDAYEHENEPVPYSLLPIEVEVLIAKVFHSVGAAQIFCHFFFPALTAWMLLSLFRRFSASLWLAGLMTLTVLILSFSLRTFYDGALALVHSGLHSSFHDTFQAARNPHPNMSFPLFLAALLSLVQALDRKSKRSAWTAGVLGGLLFYTYVYYAIAWSGCIAFATLACLFLYREKLQEALIVLGITGVIGGPFLLWTSAAKKAGGYLYRSARLGMMHSRALTPLGKDLTLFWLIMILLTLACWLTFRKRLTGISRRADATVLVFLSAALAGLAAMDMQVVTGFNIQPEIHYPHMVIQPVLFILAMIMILVFTRHMRAQKSAAPSALLFFALFALCTAEQISAAVNSAEAHRIPPSEAALFHWLNQNTAPGDVVATTDLSLCVVLPVFTHNYSLLANGSRTSGSDDEVLDRFLLANALIGAPEQVVVAELRGTEPLQSGDPTLAITNYATFLYEQSPYRDVTGPALMPAAVSMAASRYRDLNLADELRHYRVNYIYAMHGQHPAAVPGWEPHAVFETDQGTLWRLTRSNLQRALGG